MTTPGSLLVGQDTTEYWKWSVSGREVIVVSVESIDLDSSWEQIVGKKNRVQSAEPGGVPARVCRVFQEESPIFWEKFIR
jgi:hypothetical protein